MSRTKKLGSGISDSKFQNLDLYEAGDGMLRYNQLEMSRQTESRPTSISYEKLRQKVYKSGWEKPTIQLAMLIGLEREGILTIGGRRRLHKMLASQSTQVQNAAISRSHIPFNPSFWTLKEWVNRPFPFSRYIRKPKRRIGIGYRDKGSLPPIHTRGRNEPSYSIYLGEKKEWIWDLEPRIALMVQDYGYLLNHLGNGWWEPDHRLRYLMVVRRLLD